MDENNANKCTTRHKSASSPNRSRNIFEILWQSHRTSPKTKLGTKTLQPVQRLGGKQGWQDRGQGGCCICLKTFTQQPSTTSQHHDSTSLRVHSLSFIPTGFLPPSRVKTRTFLQPFLDINRNLQGTKRTIVRCRWKPPGPKSFFLHSLAPWAFSWRSATTATWSEGKTGDGSPVFCFTRARGGTGSAWMAFNWSGWKKM